MNISVARTLTKLIRLCIDSLHPGLPAGANDAKVRMTTTYYEKGGAGHQYESIAALSPLRQSCGYSDGGSFANALKAEMERSGDRFRHVIQSVRVDQAGKLLFEISPLWVEKRIEEICMSMTAGAWSRSDETSNAYYGSKSVLVDFSSPNIAKSMHVGHLRSTIIGDCLCNVFEFLGCRTVRRISHIGDWGTQFGMLLAFAKQQQYDANRVASMRIRDIDQMYKLSKELFNRDADFRARAHAEVVSLQAKSDPRTVELWRVIRDITCKENNSIYAMLDVKLDEVGESSYADDISPMLAEVRKCNNLLHVSAGAQCIFFERGKDGKDPPPMIVVKSDGGYTYSTTDLAALWRRTVVDKHDLVLYVVDDGQALHFRSLFDVGRRAGWEKMMEL